MACPSCKAFLGTLNTSESSHRLYKSRLQINDQSYSTNIFVGAQLLQLIEHTTSRRVVVYSSPPREPESSSPPPPGLLLWIFNPDIYYSASRRHDPEPTVHRALKVFYQEVDNPTKLLDSHQSTLEELAVPKLEYETLHKELLGSKDYMPLSARTFQDWQVGLLDRWEENATGLGAMDQNALNRAVEGDMELFKVTKVDLPGSEGLYD